MGYLSENEFLRSLILLSNNENRNVEIKFSTVEKKISATRLIKLSNEDYELLSIDGLTHNEKISCKLIVILPNGNIQYNPTIINQYLKGKL